MDNNRRPQETKTGKRTYSAIEVSQMLGISRQAVYQLIKQNLFQTIRTEREHRIIKASFDAWLDEK